MKKAGLLLGASLAWLCSASAQVSVEVIQDQDQFLPGEAILAKVRVTNRSGQILRMGEEADWLTFVVQDRDGALVAKNGEVPVTDPFTLGSDRMATERVDLAPYFSLTQPGRYQIVANVHIKAWDRTVSSAPKPFDIIEGAKLWEQEVGLPASGTATNGPPEVRKYILQEANYLKTHLQLYLRLTDSSETKALRVFPIGPMVSFSRPEAQVDSACNLHVLYQAGARYFNYTVFNPDGEPIIRQFYEYLNSRPRLHASGDGKVSLEGGVRRNTTKDLPPSGPPERPLELPKPILPPSTETPKS